MTLDIMETVQDRVAVVSEIEYYHILLSRINYLTCFLPFYFSVHYFMTTTGKQLCFASRQPNVTDIKGLRLYKRLAHHLRIRLYFIKFQSR